MSAPVRVLIAQGPVQLLAALAGWSFRARTEAKKTEDILVLGGYCASPAGARELDEACEKIASVWPFQKIIKTSEIDARYDEAKLTFGTYAKELRELLPRKLSEIWCCRNMQAINEAVLGAAPRALKVCYGDGLGAIDINGIAWCRPLRPKGYPAVDEICATFPIEYTEGVFSKLPVEMVPPEFFVNLVKSAAKNLPELRAAAASFNASNVHRSLVLTTNGTEAGIFANVEQEVEFYLAAVSQSIPAGSEIVVKGHPRECFSQSQKLVDALKASGRAARVLEVRPSVIVEFWATAMKFDLVCTLFSSAGPAWRMMQPGSDILCGVDPVLRKRFVKPSADAMYSMETMNAMAFAQMVMAASPNPKCLRVTAIKESAHLAPPGPIFFKARQTVNASGDPFLKKVFESAFAPVPLKRSFWDRLRRSF